MINLKEEIREGLKGWCNTNDKEQNLQGWLYAHFLKFQKDGYVVEMETNIKQDEHLEWLFKDKKVNRDAFCKSEVDLLIYHPIRKEVYAMELKWVYHRDEGWNVVDHLTDFMCDAHFCRQLLKHHICTDVCSFVAYNFNPQKQVKKANFSKEQTIKEAFLGGPYMDSNGNRRLPTEGAINGVHFEWESLYDDYYCYMIDGKDILNSSLPPYCTNYVDCKSCKKSVCIV